MLSNNSGDLANCAAPERKVWREGDTPARRALADTSSRQRSEVVPPTNDGALRRATLVQGVRGRQVLVQTLMSPPIRLNLHIKALASAPLSH
ncbi:hypothetical protein Rmet_3775 (plasmid) [Cupriavidus metallidurans CH34]|uniref:Uncharacterized protein n=1 Tax=Cupriavidus metallidurans (strain ATCC 43123 / DSM 2839 / NBRC 102507 / CH34) TaxID=266264 RepID=Q1LGT1_CUPMC|nr:hypothetical protein Rmet_3775 [Cupriavidus metallidurans CH34]